MRGDFQRILLSSDEALSLNTQAALGPSRPPRRSQFHLLVRHFLERFFSHESASPDGDAKSRLILIALATSLPGFIITLYLWPVYHPFLNTNPGQPFHAGPPPYWLQVNHHFFFVVYSFVVLGIATVFEWDLFFPDLLDMYVLTPLPIPALRLFRARVTAVALLLAGFLINANLLALFVMPATFDPPNLTRLMGGHLLAVLGAGLFCAAFILAAQSVLLAVLGEAYFRRIALAAQGLAISALLLLLLLFPVLSAAVPIYLQTAPRWIFLCPPFWFLGVYQRILEGPAALPIFTQLAKMGLLALIATLSIASLAYPLAYLRRTRYIVAGAATRNTRSHLARPRNAILHRLLARLPWERAVFHFIAQTLARVQRYRIYLVLYGGVGLAVIASSVMRLQVMQGSVHVVVAADGVRAAVAICAFWTITGLRTAFVSPGNRQGSWIFGVVNGRPPLLATAMAQCRATRLFTLLAAGAITLIVTGFLCAFAPAELRHTSAIAALLLITAGLSLLLTDAFLLTVNIVPFTGESQPEESNLALTVLKYFTLFPPVIWLSITAEPWIESAPSHFALAIAAIAASHLLLVANQQRMLAQYCSAPALEEGEPDFPFRLGLRNR